MMDRRRLATFLLAGTALAGLADAAMAQTAADTPAAAPNDEIVVTAQKRAESLQTVPISIQALGTQKLEDLNIQGGRDFSQFFPSLTYTVGGGGGTNGQPGTDTYYMRGVSSGGDGNHSAALPSVGVYLDEQPITTIGGSS